MALTDEDLATLRETLQSRMDDLKTALTEDMKAASGPDGWLGRTISDVRSEVHLMRSSLEDTRVRVTALESRVGSLEKTRAAGANDRRLIVGWLLAAAIAIASIIANHHGAW